MSRHTGPKCKLCRRERQKLFLKGERCYSDKCPIGKKQALPPGEHGATSSRRLSDYGVRLRAKQKAKRLFGVKEKAFKNYYKKAVSSKGDAGDNLVRLLETRLDNVLFKGGLAVSRSVARQLINHGHVLVDDQKVNIPSFQVKVGQVISLKPKALELKIVKESIEEKRQPSDWLKRKAAVIKMERLPQREEMESSIEEQFIIEFYSR